MIARLVLERYLLLAFAWFSRSSAFCINEVPESQRQKLYYNGKAFPFRLAHGLWDSPGPVGEVLRIILEEEFKLEVELDKGGSSHEMLKKVNGCTDAQGKFWNASIYPDRANCTSPEAFQDPPIGPWAAIEVWMSTPEEERLSALETITVFGRMGFKSLPGLYTQSSVINSGRNSGLHLKWWEAYNVSGSSGPFFTSVDDVDSSLRNLKVTKFGFFLCPNSTATCEAGHIKPLCDPDIPSSKDYYLQTVEANGFSCDGGWWRSPKCTEAPGDCIPVLLAVPEWNVIEYLYLFRDSGIAVEVTWLGWFPLQEAVQGLATHKFLFYWWEPDSSFLNLNPSRPEQVLFDERDIMISQMQNTAIVGWSGMTHLKTRDGSSAIAHDLGDFLRKLTFTDEDLEDMMLQKASGVSDAVIGCNWVKNNTKLWMYWMPTLRTDQTDQIQEYERNMESLRFNIILVAIFMGILFVVGGCIILLCWRKIRKMARKMRKMDSPMDEMTPTGDWVLSHTGKYVYAMLKEHHSQIESKFSHRTQKRRRKRGIPTWILNASPFRVTLRYDLVKLKRTSIYSNATTDSFGLHPSSPTGDMIEAGKMLSNGSEPDKSVKLGKNYVEIDLEPFGGCKMPINIGVEFSVSIENAGDHDPWLVLTDDAKYTVEAGDWSRHPTDRDWKEGDELEYTDDTVRKTLPRDENGGRMGWIKFTKRNEQQLLINWSPPHRFRGIPFHDFMDFLDLVIEQPEVWNCSVLGADGTQTEVQKGPSGSDFGDDTPMLRNMYDANQHIIQKRATLVDASWAELETDFGPANIFISHVWSKPAEFTRRALINQQARLNEFVRTSNSTHGSISQANHGSSRAMLWFCVTCNNQSRISEELGDVLWDSPFARVIRSVSVRVVLLLGPFDALSRKWCNFEFGYSHSEKKRIVMLDETGSIQDGEVAPKSLRSIAEKLQDFDCKKATCNNASDSGLIDKSVEEHFGGYSLLNAHIKGVFVDAIRQSHHHSNAALGILDELEEPTLDII